MGCRHRKGSRWRWQECNRIKPENIERTAQKWFSRSLEKIGGKKYEKYDEKSSTECKGSCRESRNVNEGYQGRELRGYGGLNPDRSRSRRTALGRTLCTLRGCGDAYPYPEDSGHVQLRRIRNTGPKQGNRKNNRRIWRKTDA